jgi:hypothetical protein
MIDHETQEWLFTGVDHAYPGRRGTNESGLFSTVVTDDGVGILILHHRVPGNFAVAAGVLSGVTYSEDLVRDLGKLNSSSVLGAYTLQEGQHGYWFMNYAIKLRYAWLDRTSRANAQLIIDILSAVPQFVIHGVERIQPKHGGELMELPDGWFLALMDSF